MKSSRFWLLLGSVCLASAVSATAQTTQRLVVDWVDAGGQTLVITQFESPAPLTQAHLDAMRIKVASTVKGANETARGMHGVEQSLTPRLVNEFELPAGDKLSADWSGVRVSTTTRFVDSCYVWAQYYAGVVRKNETYVIEAGPAMSGMAALVRVGKAGNPDLYVFDPFSGQQICSSTAPGSQPDSCAVLTNDCSNGFADVVVFGVAKSQKFTIAVWETEVY